jgi:hypothetical protein
MSFDDFNTHRCQRTAKGTRSIAALQRAFTSPFHHSLDDAQSEDNACLPFVSFG